jgi:hypothetical protein
LRTYTARIISGIMFSAAFLAAQSGAIRRDLPAVRPPASPYEAPSIRELLGAAPADLSELLERYAADLQILNRFYDVPLSSTTDRALRQFFQSWRAALDQIPFDSLPQEGRIDYLLFRNKLDQEIRHIDQQQKRSDEIASLVPFLPVIVELKERRQRVDPVDSAGAAARLTGSRARSMTFRSASTIRLKPSVLGHRRRLHIARPKQSTICAESSRTGSISTTAMIRYSRGG